jgi:CYTH domain-containing protein
MPKNLEIERKFLIAMPDEGVLARQDGARCDEILQTYLLSEPGVTARVRMRRGTRGTVYTATEKRRLSDLTAVEDEREVTEEEYRALLSRRDPALTPIEKRRYAIPYGGHTLEIDIYPFCQKQAVLEVELPTEDTPFTLPPFIRVIRDVSGDHRYKNVSLARAIPDENE